MRNPLEFFKLAWNCEGDPLSPPAGRQHEGASPLDPSGALNFFHAAEGRFTAMLHGASPEEAVSARGPIAIRYRSPLLVF